MGLISLDSFVNQPKKCGCSCHNFQEHSICCSCDCDLDILIANPPNCVSMEQITSLTDSSTNEINGCGKI